MRFTVASRRQWPRVQNHMDIRECPTCRAAVPKNRQAGHELWHREVDDLLEELCKRTGMTEEGVEVPWSWSAADAGSFNALEGPGDGLER